MAAERDPGIPRVVHMDTALVAAREEVVVTGAAGAALSRAEDSAHVTGDQGFMVLAVRQDALSVLAADGDYIPLVVDASGRLHIAPLPAGSAAIGIVDTELPAAAALGDTVANPTTPMVGAGGMVWTGAVWARAQTPRAANATAGAGVAGVHALVYDSVADVFRLAPTATADALSGQLLNLSALAGYNGATWDRLQVDGQKSLKVNATFNNAGPQMALAQITDADAGSYMAPNGGARYNGSTFDRARNNVAGTLLASAVRAASNNTAAQTNYDARGVTLYLDVTANPGGGETLTLELQEQDPVSSVWTTVTAFGVAFTAANGHAVCKLYPGAVETAAVAAVLVQGLPLPRTWRAALTHSAVGNWTYSVGYSLTL